MHARLLDDPTSFRVWALLALLGLTPFAAAVAQDAASSDPFARIRFFEGQWRGTAEGEPGQGAVERRYESVLGGRFLYERNVSDYRGGRAEGEVHEHWSFFSFDKARKKIVLRQLHVEGFVNQFVLSDELSGADKLVFESERFENFSNDWRARETYELRGSDELVETFELAPPGGELHVYSKNHLRRVSATP
jgi:hypothetical protein